MNGAAREQERPIRLAGSEFGANRHMGAFFHTADEEYRVRPDDFLCELRGRRIPPDPRRP